MGESREQLGRKYPITMVEYDPAWPRRFAEESARLRSLFSADLIPRIEHFGSTAVVGLAAKPVIDLLIEIPSFARAEGEIRPVLESEGYVYIWRVDCTPPHIMFLKGYGTDGYLPGVQRYHLHLAPAGHPFHERLAFRDYLRSHPNVAAEYAALKWRLAREHRNDREAYTEAKTAFITEIMKKAEAERAGRDDSKDRR